MHEIFRSAHLAVRVPGASGFDNADDAIPDYYVKKILNRPDAVGLDSNGSEYTVEKWEESSQKAEVLFYIYNNRYTGDITWKELKIRTTGRVENDIYIIETFEKIGCII